MQFVHVNKKVFITLGFQCSFRLYSRCINTEEFLVLVTHQVLVGTGLPFGEVEVVPDDEQKQEEGQHEELPVPHRHQEDLTRQNVTA